jgi:hypothetical protein
MSRSLIRGIEVIREEDRLVLRNTWSIQTLGLQIVLVVGFGFFACCGFMGLVPVTEGPPETPRDRLIGTVMAVIAIPLAALALLALPLSLLRHRRPFIFDRRTDRLLDGKREVCPLSSILGVSVEVFSADPPADYAVRIIRQDERRLHVLEGRLGEFPHRAHAERLAGEIGDFLGVEVVGVADRG